MRTSKLAASVKRKPQPVVKSRSLPAILGSSNPKTKRVRKGEPDITRRIDIVSEQLCDDVIGYLGPSLEQHKGCTLVDFDPGPCLFSSKLHDYLKPKKHYLIEPEQKYYKAFIKPLLEKEGSTYQHSTIPSSTHPSLRWDHQIRTKLDPELLPDRTQLPKDDPRRMQFDPSLLVIGNMARRGHQRKVFVHDRTFELQRLVLFAMAKDLLSKSGFFEAGLVRMLWWLPDLAKPSLWSTNVPNNRSPYNVALDMSFTTSEVAGVKPMHSLLDTHFHKQAKRLEEFELLISKQVTARALESGLKVPEARKLQENQPEVHPSQRNLENISPFEALTNEPITLGKHIDAVSARLTEVSKWAGSYRVAKVRDEHLIQQSMSVLEYPQCKLIGPLHSNQSAKDEDELSMARTIALVDLGLRLINLEASVKTVEGQPDFDKAILTKLQDRILSLDKRFRRMMTDAGERITKDVGRLLEDQIAFYSPSPLLSWDQRAYEPLQADPSDFYPKQDVALIDMMPRSVDLAVPDLADSAESSKACAQLLTSLLSTKKRSLPEVLERLAVNAGKDLIPMVPAITDARRGGRLNPQNLKARMLTTEMLEGLVKAWFEWPFRPQSWELSLASGEAEHVEEARESEGEIEDPTSQES